MYIMNRCFATTKYDESKYYEQMCCTKNYNLAHFSPNLQILPLLHNPHRFAYFAQFLQHLHKYSNSQNLHNCQYLHFLAVQNSSIGLIVPPAPLRVLLLLTLQTEPRDLWPLRHLIRVMNRHDLTEKIDKDKYTDKDNDNDKDNNILRTHPKSNPRDLWPLRHLFRVMRRHDITNKIDKDKYKEKDNDKDKDILRTPPKSNPRDLWHLRHIWVQFWQLRTWICDNLCFLTINCDTGQHSQFLRCFFNLKLTRARLPHLP